jgi:predicted metalloprotease with PDZ domain
MRFASAPALVLILAVPAAAQEPVRQPTPTPPPAEAPRMRWAPPAERAFDVQVFPLRRARMGITVSIEPRVTDSIGALVTAVSPGGPADRAGLRSGDLVVRLAGRSILVEGTGGEAAMARTVSPGIRLIELAARLEPNDTVAVEFRRGADRRTASLVTAPEPDYQVLVARLDSMRGQKEMVRVEVLERALAERQAELARVAERQAELSRTYERVAPTRPAPEAMAWVRLAGPLAGLEFATMNPSLAEYFGTAKGVLVTRADTGAPFGLRGGDVILSVDGRTPSGPAHLARILKSYDPGERVTLDVLRSRKRITLAGVLAPPPASAPSPRR